MKRHVFTPPGAAQWVGGDAATKGNDFRYDWLPRIDGDYSQLPYFNRMSEGGVDGYFVFGKYSRWSPHCGPLPCGRGRWADWMEGSGAGRLRARAGCGAILATMALILDYASPRPKQDAWPKAPAWVAPASLTPLFLWPTWPALIQSVDRWLNLGIGQGWERLTGMLWIGSVVLSLVWIGYYWLRPKPWYVRCCLGLHGLFIAATILPPGCIMLAWLMHWLSGPGA